jgi:hypothetical protein
MAIVEAADGFHRTNFPQGKKKVYFFKGCISKYIPKQLTALYVSMFKYILGTKLSS